MSEKSDGTGGRHRISSGSKWETEAGYSRAVADGDWCFVAGTTGPDPETGAFSSDAATQARHALAIIEGALVEAGFAMSDVVRARYHLTSRNDVAAVMAVLGDVFADTKPAATMVICELIDPAMKVEIEVTALRGG